MAGPGLWSSIKSALRRSEPPLFLNDSSAFDFSDEAGDEDFPRFNKLRVVVADDAAEGAPEAPANGLHPAPPSDDESVAERDIALRGGPEPCGRCRSRRELCKLRRVKKRLTAAAVLYLLFMTGELVEVLSAIISVLLVYILMAFLLYEAVQRTIHMDYEINGDIMLITAAVGVAVNLIMGFLLNQSGHLHSHSHSHRHSHVPQSNSPSAARSSGHGHSSLAVRAAFVHALGDLVQSIGVLVAAYIIRFKPEYKIADPICTYVFSILVVLTTVRILCDTGVIILEGVPRHLNVDRIKEDLMKIEDVYSIEDLNVWSLTAGKTTAIVHLQLVPGSSSKWEEVQFKARQLLLNTFGMYKCSVQLQSYKQESSKACASCQSSSA
ncbi:zinc transporter 4 isoform X1 [Gallus gallus]|uniref:zinc transporter 4 isoform X1 n=1 Tax=Gallus gallus TaxID=9031 RepID=UPI000D63E9F9|nr:zinc transporter 4 isoform X1 [Gallus gallus]XP_046780789.1 zinc transporter 4 isoform X1 [Gallus gallus]|eukprot:XP_004943866.2 zinc transporter 4 isoform X1 [Gallus gallus]